VAATGVEGKEMASRFRVANMQSAPKMLLRRIAKYVRACAIPMSQITSAARQHLA